MKQYTAFLSWPSLFSAINKKRNFPGPALTHSHNTLTVCVFGKYFSIEQKYIDPSPRVGQWTCTNSRNLNCMPGEIFSTGASFCAEGCNVMTRGDTGHVDTCHAWSVVTRGL